MSDHPTFGGRYKYSGQAGTVSEGMHVRDEARKRRQRPFSTEYPFSFLRAILIIYGRKMYVMFFIPAWLQFVSLETSF